MTHPLGTLTHEADVPTITFTRTYELPASSVWAAIATQEGLKAWLADGTFEGGLGGALEFHFDDANHVTGEITVWEPNQVLAHTWTIPGEPPSELTYRLSESNGATTLTLTHVRLPDAMASGYTAGWHAYLDRLEQSLTGADVQSWDELFDAVMGQYMPTTGA